MEFIKKFFGSTNATLNAVLLLVLGVSLLFNFPGNELIAIITSLIAFVGLVREWSKGGVKFGWNNGVVYIIAGLSALIPQWAGLFEALAGLVDAILKNDMNLIIAAAVVFLNVLIQQFGKKKEQPGDA